MNIFEFKEFFYSAEIIDIVEYFKHLDPENRLDLTKALEELKQDIDTMHSTHMKNHFKLEDMGEDVDNYFRSEVYIKLQQLELKLALVQFLYNGSSQNIYLLFDTLYEYDILSWCFPKWLYEDEDDKYFTHHYYIQLKCIEHGYRFPTTEEAVDTLSRFAFYTIEDIPPVTLNKHIWYLFEYENLIHNPYEGKGDAWIKTFQELIQSKKIDKTRVLNEAMLTATRFGNRAIAGYFFRLVEALKPYDDDLINLQATLLLVLQTQHSKPINQTLKYLKRIHKDPNFNLSGFMEQIPLLLSWDIKAVVNGTLSLIDALMKAYLDHKEALGLLVIQTLGQEDEGLQTKAVKLLIKHKLLEIPSILEEISIYSDGLYHSTKQMLPALNNVETVEETMEITPPTYIRDDNRIIYPESFDEMVFFFSGILSSDEPYKFDLFAALLPKIDALVTLDNVDKLAPALKRAYQYYIKWGVTESIQSYLHYLVANALVYYGWLIIRRMSDNFDNSELAQALHILFFDSFSTPKGTDFTRVAKDEYFDSSKQLNDFHKLLASLQAYNHHSAPPISFISIQKDASPLYSIKLQLQKVFAAIESNTRAPIPLCTPTHLPCFVDASSFIKRLLTSEKISDAEMQTALLRLDLTTLDISMLKDISSHEITALLQYLCSHSSYDNALVEHPAWWLIAILRRDDKYALNRFVQTYGISTPKSNDLLEVSFEVIQKPWEYDTWEKGKKVTKVTIERKLKLHKNHFLLNLPFDTPFKNIYLQKQNSEIPSLDAAYGLYLMPSIPEPYLIQLLSQVAEYWSSAQINRTLEDLMLHLIEIWRDFHPSTYLFVAAMTVYENKTVRQLSSELWIKATYEGTMNHQLLGETLGKLEHNEYAPLKRFTDLIVSNMLNISTLHNQGLHTLLSAMIAQMNDAPIKGTKKLLEIYLQVLSLTKLDVPSETLDRLGVWGEVKSLKSVIDKIAKG